MNLIHNCFPQELAERLHSLVSNAEWKYGWRSNSKMGYGHWNKNYGGNKGNTYNSIDIAPTLKEQTIIDAWNYLQAMYVPDTVLLRCYANGHTYGVEGYPHTDSDRLVDQTIVVYLNKNWCIEWGGETMLYENNAVSFASLPKFNQGLQFNGNQLHSAKSVGRTCPDLRMTLMFKFAPKNSDPIRDNIQDFLQKIGANKIDHSGRKLINHLLRTYDLLKSKGCEQDVCSAGALHSIFGTNIFKHKTMDIRNKQRIIDLIGESATELVEIFSLISRPETLTSTSTQLKRNDGGVLEVSEKILKQLQLIECANLKEQNALNKYPNLVGLWNCQNA